MSLAACKVEVKEEFAPKLGEFKREVTKDYKEWINIVKDRAFRAGVPLRAELLNLVYDSNDDLGHEGASSCGNRAHSRNRSTRQAIDETLAPSRIHGDVLLRRDFHPAKPKAVEDPAERSQPGEQQP